MKGVEEVLPHPFHAQSFFTKGLIPKEQSQGERGGGKRKFPTNSTSSSTAAMIAQVGSMKLSHEDSWFHVGLSELPPPAQNLSQIQESNSSQWPTHPRVLICT